MKFKDNLHKERFNTILKRMHGRDCYYQAVAYLLTLCDDCYKHINDLFDFEKDGIKPKTALEHSWHTGTSCKVTRLAFNLWSGFAYEHEDGKAEEYTDDSGSPEWLPSKRFSVNEIFCCSYAPYFWEAIKIRYPEYTARYPEYAAE